MDAKWLLGGVCAAAGLGLLIYSLADDGRGSCSSSAPLTREQFLRLLSDLRKETSSALINLAGFAQSIKQQVEGKIPDEVIREILMTQSPLKEIMKKAEEKVYQKHGVTEDLVHQAYFVDFKDDPDVRKFANDMSSATDNAFKGIPPMAEAKLPDFLTPEKVIEIMHSMYEASGRVTVKKLRELRKQGVQIDPYDARFQAATQPLEADIEAEKEKIYELFGLSALEDPAPLVLAMAVQRYSSNMQFASMMHRIETEHKMKMEGLLMGRRDPDEEYFDDAEDNEGAERLAQMVEGAMVGAEERIVEKMLKQVGERPPKVEVLPDDSPSGKKPQRDQDTHSAPPTPLQSS